MFLLDTNVISEVMRPGPDPSVVDWWSAVATDELFIPAIAKAELLFSIAVLPDCRRRDDLAAMIGAFLEPFERDAVLPFASREAEAYADIVAARRRIGRPIREPDAQIAAIARTRNLAVATRNIHDFDKCGVFLINPWDRSS